MIESLTKYRWDFFLRHLDDTNGSIIQHEDVWAMMAIGVSPSYSLKARTTVFVSDLEIKVLWVTEDFPYLRSCHFRCSLQ